MKILIIKNRYTKKLNWKKGIEWFAKNTPIKLEIEELSTDFDLKFKKVSNATYSGVVPVIHDELRTIVPANKYDCVCFIYGNKAPGISVSFADDEPLYPNTDLIQVDKFTDGGKTFNHEIFHIFFKKLARKGINLSDPMDTYHNDKNLDAEVSNRTVALELLKPYWKLITDVSNPVTNKTTNVKTKDLEWSYKWFNLIDDPKMLGIEHELMVKLDAIRDEAGFPIVITSGKRTKAENDALKDSASNSGHLRGFEVDIACTDSAKRDRIIELSYKHGITRRGIGKDFIHLGIDPSLPQHVMWHYYK